MTDKLKTLLPALLFTLAGFLIEYQFVDPAPPSEFNMAAGQPGGAYNAFAMHLRDELAKDNITLHVQTSAGSMENIHRLREGQADAAYVQSGLISADTQLESLGSMYYEPLWVFLAPGVNVHLIRDMKGKRLAVGLPGSGTRALAAMLLKENDVGEKHATWLSLSSNDAADALLSGRADVAFMVGAPTASAIARLNLHSQATLMSMQRAPAYARQHRALSVLTLPRGTLNPAADLPTGDTQLLAATASLLINKNLHPALQDILLQAAARVHGGSSLFAAAGYFPNARHSGLPLSLAARRYYKSGPPLLQRYLPFWAATMINRLKVMLLPFIALLLPLFKIMPPLYRWRIRSRIYRWYEELGRIDQSLYQGNISDSALREQLAKLDQIEAEIRKVHVPLSYADALYDLRLHLAFVRGQAPDLSSPKDGQD